MVCVLPGTSTAVYGIRRVGLKVCQCVDSAGFHSAFWPYDSYYAGLF